MNSIIAKKRTERDASTLPH